MEKTMIILFNVQQCNKYCNLHFHNLSLYFNNCISLKKKLEAICKGFNPKPVFLVQQKMTEFDCYS